MNEDDYTALLPTRTQAWAQSCFEPNDESECKNAHSDSDADVNGFMLAWQYLLIRFVYYPF